MKWCWVSICQLCCLRGTWQAFTWRYRTGPCLSSGSSAGCSHTAGNARQSPPASTRLNQGSQGENSSRWRKVLSAHQRGAGLLGNNLIREEKKKTVSHTLRHQSWNFALRFHTCRRDAQTTGLIKGDNGMMSRLKALSQKPWNVRRAKCALWSTCTVSYFISSCITRIHIINYPQQWWIWFCVKRHWPMVVNGFVWRGIKLVLVSFLYRLHPKSAGLCAKPVKKATQTPPECSLTKRRNHIRDISSWKKCGKVQVFLPAFPHVATGIAPSQKVFKTV